MIAMDVLSDALFAAVAGMGFGAISCPPKRAFPYIALLAAVGHAARFCLMTFPGVDLATGSLAAALLIGFGSLWLGRRCRTPMTVLNAMVTCSVIFMLAVGATLPMFLFPKRAYSITRRR